MERPPLPAALTAEVRRWDSLSRWELSEVGRALRRLGWSYGEIGEVIAVPRSTIAGWCRGTPLSPEQAEAIRARTGSRKGIPRDTQRKRREEVERIREEARAFALDHLHVPLWMAGTTLYWGEGAKTQRQLALVNADPRTLRLFIEWIRAYHDSDARFSLRIHLHEGNDEGAAKAHWRTALRLPDTPFQKTFIKPAGTGHRTNRLSEGVCRVRMKASSNAWYRTMTWIDVIADVLAN